MLKSTYKLEWNEFDFGHEAFLRVWPPAGGPNDAVLQRLIRLLEGGRMEEG